MTEYPVRNPLGQIVDFQDTRPAPPEPSPVEPDAEPVAEPEPRTNRARNPEQHRPLSELLGQPAAATTAKAPPTVAGWYGPALLMVLIIGGALTLLWGRDTAVPQEERAPASTVAPTAQASAVPTTQAAPSAVLATVAVVAYDAPGGAALGAIDSQQALVFVARYGTAWVRVVRPGIDDAASAPWLRVAELPVGVLDPAILNALPDLTPPPTATPEPAPVWVPPPPIAVPAPVEQAPVIEAVPTAVPAAPAPTEAPLQHRPGRARPTGAPLDLRDVNPNFTDATPRPEHVRVNLAGVRI